MTKKHLAIFTQMGNGHVYPNLALCSELSARGYRVTCATNERYRSHVCETGAEAVVFIDTPVDEALRAENQRRFRLPVNDASRMAFSALEWGYLSRSTEDFLSQVGHYYRDNMPDLVLYNRYFIPGRIIAHQLQAPAVQLSPHFAYPGRSRFWERGVARDPQELAAYSERLDGLLAAHGITTRDNLWHLERLNVHFVPKEFQYRAELFDDSVFFAGCLLERPLRRLWNPPSDSMPRMLIAGYSGIPETQVTDLRYFKTFIEALAGVACHCILSVGEHISAQSLGPLPDNFELNQHASHLEILPRVTLFAGHGGMGSSLEALYNGVPVLAVPTSPYTEEVAHRVVELGVGELLPRSEFNAERVRALALSMIRDEALQARTSALQQKLRHSGGTVATADRLERCLSEI